MSTFPRAFPFLRLSAALLLLTATTAAPPRPHVIQILFDDWGWGDTSFNFDTRGSGEGPSAPRTPNLERLVGSGLKAPHWNAGSPVCSPSRLSLMTSRFPAEFAFHTALTGNATQNEAIGCANFLPLETPFLPRLLSEYGNYSTAHFGKWHLGSTPDAPCPSAYGFPEPNATATYVSGLSCPQLGDFSDVWFPSNSSRLIVDHGIAFATAALSLNKSFFMNLNFHISHAPLLPTPEQLERAGFPATSCAYSGNPAEPDFYPRCPEQTFRASQFEADFQVGRLLDWLIARGIEDDTIIFATADNGPEAQEVYFNSVGLTGPFRGRKRSLYEGGIRVPALWRWPRVLPQNETRSHVYAHVDFAPTILALTGVGAAVPPAEVAAFEGIDVSASLLHDTPPPTRAVALKWEWRYGVIGPCWYSAPRFAVRDPTQPDMVALWEPSLVDNSTARLELYNTTADPYELNNLASAAPADAARLVALLRAWYVTLPPPPAQGPPGVVSHWGCSDYRASFAVAADDAVVAEDVEAARGHAAARAALKGKSAAELYEVA